MEKLNAKNRIWHTHKKQIYEICSPISTSEELLELLRSQKDFFSSKQTSILEMNSMHHWRTENFVVSSIIVEDNNFNHFGVSAPTNFVTMAPCVFCPWTAQLNSGYEKKIADSILAVTHQSHWVNVLSKSTKQRMVNRLWPTRFVVTLQTTQNPLFCSKKVQIQKHSFTYL